MIIKNVSRNAAVVLASMLCASCAHQQVKSKAQPEAAQASTEASKSEADMRGDTMRSIPELKAVHFDYDSSFLKPEARAILVSNAAWLKDHQDVRVQIAGNCDQRGTVEYNLALGERRASAVRDYYVHMGIPIGGMSTISYGKEKPLCQEMEESCWLKNRRAETLEAISGNANGTVGRP